MKPFKNAWQRALWLAGGILMLASALGGAGSASATSLLFLPESGKFPYHLAAGGFLGHVVLLTASGDEFLTEAIDASTAVRSATLFELQLLFLLPDIIGGGAGLSCSPGEISWNLLGHFGSADPGSRPAVLLLAPAGLASVCRGTTVLVRGAAVGLISQPGTGVASELLDLSFKQTKAQQEFTSFLLFGGGLKTDQLLETRFDGGPFGTSEFEKSALQFEALPLKSLSGEGKFTLELAP